VNEELMAADLARSAQWAKAREKDIVRWLENFKPEHRELALQLLRGVRVCSASDYHQWCRALHSYLPLEIRQNAANTRYVGLGLPSESGSLVSFYYRAANGIAVEQFVDLNQAVDSAFLTTHDVQTLIFLDDFIGSGNQAIEFWQSLSLRLGEITDAINFFYSAFIGYRDGKENIEDNTKFKVNVVRQLDESDKAFGVGSKVFVEYAREIAKGIFREYGGRLFPRHPLGYRDGQLLITFEHNTPNNTLPVLWSEEDNWFPLFTRYDKVHLPGSKKPSEQSTPLSTVRPVRKAIMFTDQVNSSSSTARRTSSEIGQVALERGEITAEVVRKYRGTIVKDTGDGALIEFPSGRDAVLCGFVLQQQVKRRNAIQKNSRLIFDLSIGIDSGEVVILPDGTLQGSAANRAARVCSLCPPGEIYFTERVKSEINEREIKSAQVGVVRLKGTSGEETIHRLIEWAGAMDITLNPFIWRGAITKPEDFFNRDNEQRTIRDYLRGRQNCQIVGPRRIGKTSLLKHLERIAPNWNAAAVVAYIDLQSPRSFTLAGWLEQVGRQFDWPNPPSNLADFSEAVDNAISTGQHPVLCLDEFEETLMRPTEFTRDFRLTLRACGQKGMSIITVSRKPLSELTEPADSSSPFYNTFPLLPLASFTKADAEDFITFSRPGVPAFTVEERKAILEFAKGHPLALQVACFHVLEARVSGDLLIAAVQRATDDMRAQLPSW
jgi:class 3 adenylate cyclase